MSNIKYTNDGKKVLVLGKLNAEQSIVQEIFVSEGQEIPSGENFVVKSLHDKPVESWKEKRLRELEQNYESERKRLEGEIDRMRQCLSAAKEKAKIQADAILRFVKGSDESQIETLKRFMAGEITHVYITGHSPEIVDWTDSTKQYDVDSWSGRIKHEGLKLISILGKSDGDLSYRLHQYRDGSGNWQEIYPACSYQDALAMAQKDCDELCAKYLADEYRGLDLDRWAGIEGIVIPPAALEKRDAERLAQRNKKIAELRDQLAKLEAAS